MTAAITPDTATDLDRVSIAGNDVCEHLRDLGIHDLTCLTFNVHDGNVTATIHVNSHESVQALRGPTQAGIHGTSDHRMTSWWQVPLAGLSCTIIGPPAPFNCHREGCDVAGHHRHTTP